MRVSGIVPLLSICSAEWASGNVLPGNPSGTPANYLCLTIFAVQK
jgi:hypothetical protein